jgi:propanol-preferring alcohol dehydrogenase
MRAVQAVTADAPFELREIPVPDPGPGQVRVRVRACGVCTGEQIVRHGALGAQLPRVPGHEVAGEVDAVGDGVTLWQPGQRVGVGWHGGSCHVCDHCRRGETARCARRAIVGTSYDGGYADYLVAPQDALARIPDALSFEEAAPLMCAGLTTFNALRNSGARPGDTVAVQGVGGLGHLAVQFADKMGFRTVAISRGRDKEEIARRLGADEYVDSEAGSAGEALAALGGAAVALSTAPDAAAQSDLVGGLRPGGRLIVVAFAMRPIEVEGIQLVRGGRQVSGWSSGHALDAEEMMAFAVLKGVRAIVETYPLERAEEAFQNLPKARYRGVLLT